MKSAIVFTALLALAAAVYVPGTRNHHAAFNAGRFFHFVFYVSFFFFFFTAIFSQLLQQTRQPERTHPDQRRVRRQQALRGRPGAGGTGLDRRLLRAGRRNHPPVQGERSGRHQRRDRRDRRAGHRGRRQPVGHVPDRGPRQGAEADRRADHRHVVERGSGKCGRTSGRCLEGTS